MNVCVESRSDQVEGRLKGERLHSAAHYLQLRCLSLARVTSRSFRARTPVRIQPDTSCCPDRESTERVPLKIQTGIWSRISDFELRQRSTSLSKIDQDNQK